jgi:hypothetical protein
MNLKHLNQKTAAVTKSLLEDITILETEDKMKDNRKLNQYCSVHRYVYKEAYEQKIQIFQNL